MQRWMIVLLVLFWTLPGFATVDIKGVSFVERRQVADSELQLTGSAVLTWALFFDVYVGAFYLPAGQTGAAWNEDVPKLLELSYLRNFKAGDFSSSSDKLLREKLTPEQYQTLSGRLREFYQLFRDVGKGDRYSLVYHPAGGTELRLNDKPLGSVPGHDFAVAYFGLWLGEKPISANFRDKLLGG